MPQYVLVNRRSGMFTNNAKIASRATVPATLGLLTSARIIADHQPTDPLAGQVAALRATLPTDSILEPAVRRNLHRRIPIELQPAMPHTVTAKASAVSYKLTVTAAGKPLRTIDVMLYLRDPGGQVQTVTVKTDAKGKLTFSVPSGFQMAFVEPIPYASPCLHFRAVAH